MLPIFVLCETFIIFISMLYLYQGDIYITPMGEQTKQYKDLYKEHKGKLFDELMFFIFYVYSKVDNHYFAQYDVLERQRVVREEFGILSDDKKYDKIKMSGSYLSFIDYYQDIQLSENEKIAEAFRTKISYWRNMLLENHDPDTEKSLGESLKRSMDLYNEYRNAAEREVDEDDSEASLYLFEIPENHKKPHLKFSLT